MDLKITYNDVKETIAEMIQDEYISHKDVSTAKLTRTEKGYETIFGEGIELRIKEELLCNTGKNLENGLPETNKTLLMSVYETNPDLCRKFARFEEGLDNIVTKGPNNSELPDEYHLPQCPLLAVQEVVDTYLQLKDKALAEYK